MATLNKLNTSNGKITVNFPFINDDGSDSKYIISANQIGWGSNSVFKEKQFSNTIQLLEAIEQTIDGIVTEVSSSVPTLTVTNTQNELEWNTQVEVAKINEQPITVKLPDNPNTDTKVNTVGDHYKTTSFSSLPIVNTEALYTIKTDAAGHITNATKVNLSDYALKSEYNALLAEFNELKEFIDWNV